MNERSSPTAHEQSLLTTYQKLLTLSDDVGCSECKVIIPRLQKNISAYGVFTGYHLTKTIQEKLKDLQCQIETDITELNEH